MINWIDVKDRLPLEFEDVLVATPDCGCGFTTGFQADEGGYWVAKAIEEYITVTHWAEVNLPEA